MEGWDFSDVIFNNHKTLEWKKCREQQGSIIKWLAQNPFCKDLSRIFCSQFPTFDIVWIFWANCWTPCDWASRSCKGHLELCENLRWVLWWCLHKWSNANHFNIKHGKTLYFTYHYCIQFVFIDTVHYLFVRLHFATPIQITSGDGLNP